MTDPVFVCHTPGECFANLPPSVCSRCMPILRAREGDWLPATMELSTGPLWRRDLFRIRIQNFVGVAVSQTRDCRQGLVFGSAASVPELGHQRSSRGDRFLSSECVLGPLLPGHPNGCAALSCHNGPSPFPSTTPRGTGFMSDLLVNIQGLAQDQQPGHSSPAAPHPMDELGGGLWHFWKKLGSSTPLFLPSSEAPLPKLSNPQLPFPHQSCANPGEEARPLGPDVGGSGCPGLACLQFLPPTLPS